MTSYISVLKSILGRFWLQFWKDSWLIQGLLAIYNKFIYPIFHTILNNLYIQTSVFYPKLDNVIIPRRVLLLKQSRATKTIQHFSFSNGSIQAASQASGYQYKIIDMYSQSLLLYDDVYMTGKQYTNFQVYEDRLYTDINFETQPTVASRVWQVTSDSVIMCYQLWGIGKQLYPVVDNFATVAKVPAYWAVLYPGAIEDAWTIRQLGATKISVLSLLRRVCKRDDIYIYQGETPNSTIVPRIPVLTSVGVMYAQNQSKSKPINGLPLTGSSDMLQSYRTLCRQLSDSTDAPIVSLPGSVNPMEYLIQQIWGSSCVILVVPAVQNQKDMQFALSCILQNMPAGAIVILYQNQSIQQPIQLNLTAQNQMLVYYTEKQRDGLIREINQWV